MPSVLPDAGRKAARGTAGEPEMSMNFTIDKVWTGGRECVAAATDPMKQKDAPGCRRTPGSRTMSIVQRIHPGLFACALLLACVAAAAFGAQTDIAGPAGSAVFGTTTTTLTNGNIVVSDPDGLNNAIGAVYLYSPAGALISTLKGHAKNDRIGSGGITALSNGNFVVSSPNWDDGVTAGVGAVTWVDGTSVGELEEGDTVDCSPADRSARLVTFGRRNFHRILKAKFGLSDR